MIKDVLNLIDKPLKNFMLFQILCAVWGILYTICSLVFPTAVSKLIDKVIINHEYSRTFYYLSIILISGLLMIVFNYIQYIEYYKFGQKGKLTISEKIFDRILHANGKFREKYSSGDILRIIEQDSNQIENFIGQGIGQIAVNIIVVVGVIILILIQQPIIGIIMIILSVVFSFVQAFLSYMLKQEASELREDLGKISSFSSEIILHSEQVATSGYVETYFQEYKSRNKKIYTKNVSQMSKILIGRNIGIAYNVIGNLITMGIGVYEIRNGNMTVGSLLAFTMYVQRLYGPLVIISNSYLNLKRAVPHIERIKKFLNNAECIIDGSIKPEMKIRGTIVFENVSFKYDEKEVLKKCNLQIESGKLTAIIGDNGSGKSTLIKLLLKIYNRSSGEIFVDNIDINKYSNDYLFNNISVMFQNNFLISGKLIDIINPGKKELDINYIYSLFQRVKLDINKFENGLDTYICENNINISGGELQKLNIIKILIEDRPLIILDEPTSALDNDSEDEICELFEELLRGRTVIIVTHRKRILKICDKIINFNVIQEV